MWRDIPWDVYFNYTLSYNRQNWEFLLLSSLVFGYTGGRGDVLLFCAVEASSWIRSILLASGSSCGCDSDYADLPLISSRFTKTPLGFYHSTSWALLHSTQQTPHPNPSLLSVQTEDTHTQDKIFHQTMAPDDQITLNILKATNPQWFLPWLPFFNYSWHWILF